MRIRRKVMGIRDVCVPGGGTPPLREDGRLGGFAGGSCGYGRFYCDNPSVSFADSSLYTREPWVRRWTGGFFVLLRSDPSSVSCADTFPHGEGFGAGRI